MGSRRRKGGSLWAGPASLRSLGLVVAMAVWREGGVLVGWVVFGGRLLILLYRQPLLLGFVCLREGDDCLLVFLRRNGNERKGWRVWLLYCGL